MKFAGVPQTRQQISAVNRPKFTILSGHVEEVLLFNKFFSDCRYMPYFRRYGPTKLCDGAKMAIFCILYFQGRKTVVVVVTHLQPRDPQEADAIIIINTTCVLRPFFRDLPGEPVPEENF